MVTTHQTFHVLYIVACSLTIVGAGTLALVQMRLMQQHYINQILFLIAACDVTWASLRLVFYGSALAMPNSVDGIKLTMETHFYMYRFDLFWSFIIVLGSTFLVASSLWTIVLASFMYRLYSKPVDSNQSFDLMSHHGVIWSICVLYWATAMAAIVYNDGFSMSVYGIIVVENTFELAAILWALNLMSRLVWRHRNRPWNPVHEVVLSQLRRFLLTYSICLGPGILTNYVTSINCEVLPDGVVGAFSTLFYLVGFVNSLVYGLNWSCLVRCLTRLGVKHNYSVDEFSYYTESSQSAQLESTFAPRETCGVPCSVPDSIPHIVEPPKEHPFFVFTDVQGSTSLWQTFPEAMRIAQDMHDQVLRSLLPQNAGYEITTEGDAFQLAFQCPLQAVAWCCDVQKRLLEVKWPIELLGHDHSRKEYCSDELVFSGLRVRMGVHGSFKEKVISRVHPITKRAVYIGKPFLVAQAIGDIGSGGQIVISDDVFSFMVSQNAIEQMNLCIDDLGIHCLKDIDDPQHIYNVLPVRLKKREFPPVSTKKFLVLQSS